MSYYVLIATPLLTHIEVVIVGKNKCVETIHQPPKSKDMEKT